MHKLKEPDKKKYFLNKIYFSVKEVSSSVDTLISYVVKHGILKFTCFSWAGIRHTLKAEVWWGILHLRVTGPIFFIEIVNAEHYL